jgi:hypothetical protein
MLTVRQELEALEAERYGDYLNKKVDVHGEYKTIGEFQNEGVLKVTKTETGYTHMVLAN